MTGEISSIAPIAAEDFRDVDLIKNMKKKNRRKTVGIIIGAVLGVSIIAVFILSQMYGQVKYKDVEFRYGVQGEKAYFTMESKPGYELYFSGSVDGGDSSLKVYAVRKIGSSTKDKMGWENKVGTKENPCKWTIVFEDKTIVIENGKLAEENGNGQS